MKIQILSDLHTEFGYYEIKNTDSDIVVIAGDVGRGYNVINYLNSNIKNKQVLFVPGNHEFHYQDFNNLTKTFNLYNRKGNIEVLEKNIKIIDDYLFIGFTMWSDFNLYNNKCISKIHIEKNVNDFELIKYKDRKLEVDDISDANAWDMEWFRDILYNNKEYKKIIITHNAPSEKSIHLKYFNNILNPYFANNLEELICSNENIKLWIHGHSHNSSDYYIGDTRVICNPRGYFPNDLNKDFKDDLVIEV